MLAQDLGHVCVGCFKRSLVERFTLGFAQALLELSNFCARHLEASASVQHGPSSIGSWVSFRGQHARWLSQAQVRDEWSGVPSAMSSGFC
jgi:hypothetical protein